MLIPHYPQTDWKGGVQGGGSGHHVRGSSEFKQHTNLKMSVEFSNRKIIRDLGKSNHMVWWHVSGSTKSLNLRKQKACIGPWPFRTKWNNSSIYLHCLKNFKAEFMNSQPDSRNTRHKRPGAL